MSRRRLPERRRAETCMLQWGRQSTVFAVTIGYYADGTPGEVFISGAKVGSDVDAATRDNAVLISLGLQHGVPLEVMRSAITRESNGEPSTIAGRVIDMLVGLRLASGG